MKLLLTIASVVALSVSVVIAGRPSTAYLPPNFAAVGAGQGSSQYPRYHGVSSVGSGGIGHGHHGGGHYGGVGVGGGGGGSGGGGGPASSFHAASHYGQQRGGSKQIPILRNEYSNDGNGHYNFGFETGNGIKRDEVGHLQGGWPHGSLDVKGSYSYTGDDGKVYSVSYKADSNGFHAEGAHLPTPPPIPKEIQETLHLHQRRPGGSPASGSYGGGQHGSSAHHGSLGHNNNAGASSHHHHNPPPHRTPSTQYLPPPQASSFHYSKRH